MSILFDAWRRARGEDEVSRALGAPAPEPRRGGALPWILFGALLVVVVGLGVYLWRVRRSPARPATGGRSAVVSSAGRAARAAGAASRQAGAGTRAHRKALSAPVGTSGLTQASQVGAAPATHRTATDAHRPLVTASPSRASEPRTVPDAVRAEMPTLDVTVHVWNPEPNARFIMVGGKIYHEGDALGAGMRLLKITRSGEIVRFRGYRIMLGR